MSSSVLFLGLTGSVATRMVGKMVDTAYESGFDTVQIHPTASAIPFLVETVLHDFPEARGLSGTMLGRIESLVEKGFPMGHSTLARWFRLLEQKKDKIRSITLKRILSGYEDGTETTGIRAREKWDIRHIRIARGSAAVLIAPATANTIAKIVHGTTDNFLLEVIRAVDHTGKVPVFIAPAMNTQMLHDPFTRRNMRLLETVWKPKYHVLPTAEKQLQCGEFGSGWLLQVNEIFRRIQDEVKRIQNHKEAP